MAGGMIKEKSKEERRDIKWRETGVKVCFKKEFRKLTLMTIEIKLECVKNVVNKNRVSYVCTTMGILYTLPSSTLKLFSSENTTLDRIMTETEVSFMGSISSASTLLITPLCGYFLDFFGRKRTLLLFYLPQLLGWLLLVTVFSVEAFIFAMFLCGLSGSIFLIVPVYVNEFCDPAIRGALCSCSLIFNGVGMLVSYLFGGILEYNTMNYTGLTMTIIGIIMVCFLKESPIHLMKKGYEEEAAASIAFYKGVKPNTKEVIYEMNNIRRLLNSDIEQKVTPEEETLKPEEKQPLPKIQIWKYLAKSRSTRLAIFCLLILNTLCIFQGIVVVQIFAGPLFEAAVPNMSGTMLSVLFAISSIGTFLIAACLVDMFGRRKLIICASLSTGVFCLILGTHLQFPFGPSWLRAVFMYLYVISFTMGPGIIPNVLLGEMFLPEIKAFATTLIVEWIFLCNFIILFMFNPIFNAYGLGPLFYTFASFSFITAVFTFIYLPETKCLPVDVIQQKILQKLKL